MHCSKKQKPNLQKHLDRNLFECRKFFAGRILYWDLEMLKYHRFYNLDHLLKNPNSAGPKFHGCIPDQLSINEF